MKRVITLLIILLSFSANAQVFSNFGIKLGYTSANMTFDAERFDSDGDYPKHSRKDGFNFSLFGESKLASTLFLISNLEYSQKGFITNTSQADTVRFHTISLEALCKYKFNLGVINPFITIGPRLDILLFLENLGKYYYREAEVINWANHRTYKSFSWGGTVSIGSEFVISDDRTLFIEFSYKPGFTDLLDEENWTFENLKNDAIDISVGMIF